MLSKTSQLYLQRWVDVCLAWVTEMPQLGFWTRDKKALVQGHILETRRD